MSKSLSYVWNGYSETRETLRVLGPSDNVIGVYSNTKCRNIMLSNADG